MTGAPQTLRGPVGELAADPQALAERLASLPEVPGAQTAGILRDTVRLGAAGVADAVSADPVLDATRFRPGSLTKLLTADLLMRCVRTGRVAAHTPVADLVPGPWPAGLRVRHLVSHTSGLDCGGLFVDTGDEEDCVARYVERLREAGTLFPPGTAFSYANGSFVLAGRIIELVLGRPWEEAVRTELLGPLGMADTGFVTGRETPAGPAVARGHAVRSGVLEALPARTDEPMTARAMGPAGGTLLTTAADLARFLVAHLASPWAATMRTLQVPVPGGTSPLRGPGLGWLLWRGPGHDSARIGGTYPGQSGIVAVDPAAGAAIVVLTNAEQGAHAVSPLLDAGPEGR
ncbi:serine hydrolase domain-containing protein [Streptomyces olivochromogenes]|uniref:serine hydrolase domain-containing protein n=1 Tax=Streptomyces olivochromogenes TaxID=1963 RepID=UPI001F3FB702|nr:serine hydrolase domain-containing protein [Streptomyces olivochromogenes]MCF3135096.1 beta-lactamase family protein [Streptomyces olivochromogenes]